MRGLVLTMVVVTALGLVYGVTALVVAHLFTRAERRVPVQPHGQLFERVCFASRADSLPLTAWYRPAVEARGAVVLVHGRNACRGDELRGPTFPLADAFLAAGLSVVMLDLRGHGESGDARVTFGRRERFDVLGAVDFLRARGYAASRIGLLGGSMGGVSVVGAAAEEPAIGAVVTDSAFVDFGDLMRLRFRRFTRLPGMVRPAAMALANLLTGERLAHHMAVDARQLNGRPVLVIHAAEDPMVPVAHAEALAAASGASLWITPTRGHLSSFSGRSAEYLATVPAFFARHLAAGGIGGIGGIGGVGVTHNARAAESA